MGDSHPAPPEKVTLYVCGCLGAWSRDQVMGGTVTCSKCTVDRRPVEYVPVPSSSSVEQRRVTKYGWAHADDDSECFEPAWCQRPHVRTAKASESPSVEPSPTFWPTGPNDREEVGPIGDGTPHARMRWFWKRMECHEQLIAELVGWSPVSSKYRFEAAIADAFDKLADNPSSSSVEQAVEAGAEALKGSVTVMGCTCRWDEDGNPPPDCRCDERAADERRRYARLVIEAALPFLSSSPEKDESEA